MRKLLTSLFISLLALFSLSVTGVSAKVITNEGGTVTVSKTEIVNDDLFISAQTAEIDGIVNGDVFIGAQTVRIPGTINGNLHIGGQYVTLEGTVKGSVYVGAQDINVTSVNISGSLLTGSQNLNIDKDSTVGGSIISGAAALKIDSQVKRNVFAGAGNIIIGENAKIGKDLYYASGENQATVSEKAVISGETHKTEAKTPEKDLSNLEKNAPKLLKGVSTVGSLLSFFGSLLVASIYIKLFGKHFNDSSLTVTKSFWKSMLTGFLVVIAIIPGIVILLITVVGIPVAGLSFLIFLIYSYLSKIVVGWVLGNLISKRVNWKMSVYGACAFGLLTIFIIRQIPYVGGLFGFVVYLTGLGAITLQLFSKPK